MEIKLPVPVPATVVGQFSFVVDISGYGGTPADRVRAASGLQWMSPEDVSDANVAGAVMVLAGGVGRFRLDGHGMVVVPVAVGGAVEETSRAVSSAELYRPTAEELAAASN